MLKKVCNYASSPSTLPLRLINNLYILLMEFLFYNLLGPQTPSCLFMDYDLTSSLTLHKCLYDKLIIIHQVIYILSYVCLSVFCDLGLVPILIAGTRNFNIQNCSSGLPIFTREKDWLRHSNFRLLLWFHRATGVLLVFFFFFCVNVDINFKMERHAAGKDSLVVKIDCRSFEDLKSQQPWLMAHTTLTQFQGIYYPLLLIISSGL